jgi:hypothetical protein
VTPQQPGAERRDGRCAERRDGRCAERRDGGCAERRGARLAAGLGLLLLLGGCSDVPNPINPVSWWHDLEGGAIAQDRPPPPNPNAPFPKIANQPTRPAGMPDWEWAQLSAALAAQRAQAQTYAAQNPIPTLPQAPGQPAAVARKPTPPPAPTPAPPAATPADAGQSAATAAEIARLAAAPGPAGSQTPAPSAAAVATATANAGNTSTSALTFQGPSAPPPSSGPQSVPIRESAATPGSPNPGGPVAGTKISYFDSNNGLSIPGALSPVEQPDEAHPPPVPSSVPVPPAVPGFAISTIPSTYVAPVPLPEPAPYVPPAPLPGVGPVPIKFAPHSAVLTPPMQRALLNLAEARGAARIAVTGFGDAATDSIGAQAAAMPLALERTRAMVVQLMAYGLPPTTIDARALALGSGGLARLVD